jgi:hypothetical protein
MRRVGAHRRGRIWPGMPADWRSSDERFRRGAMELAREKKGDEGGIQGAFIGGPGLERGLGFLERGAMDGQGNAVQGQGSSPRKIAKLTGGAGLSAGIGGGRRNVSVWGRTGPWAASLAWSVRPLRPVFLLFFCTFIFLFLFPLFFHIFCKNYPN